jgi:hypothetical protein
MELSIDNRSPGILVATVSGEIDMAVAAELRDGLCDAVRSPAANWWSICRRYRS